MKWCQYTRFYGDLYSHRSCFSAYFFFFILSCLPAPLILMALLNDYPRCSLSKELCHRNLRSAGLVSTVGIGPYTGDNVEDKTDDPKLYVSLRRKCHILQLWVCEEVAVGGRGRN